METYNPFQNTGDIFYKYTPAETLQDLTEVEDIFGDLYDFSHWADKIISSDNEKEDGIIIAKPNDVLLEEKLQTNIFDKLEEMYNTPTNLENNGQAVVDNTPVLQQVLQSNLQSVLKPTLQQVLQRIYQPVYQPVLQPTLQTSTKPTNRNNKKSQIYEWDKKNRIPKQSTKIAERMMSIYKSMNIPAHIAAAIVGNLYAESSFDPSKINPNDVGQVSSGLLQWDSSRLKKLKAFANRKNKPWTNLNILLEFILEELKTYFPKSYLNLINSRTPSEASEALAPYIKYAGYDGTTGSAKKAGWPLERVDLEHRNRLNYSNEVYNRWKY